MKLCITEKPSVARDIASILGCNTKRDGYYEGGEFCVTWTLGHLCCLYEPHDYDPRWKRWSFSALPMLPAKYHIKLIDDPGYKHQFDVIESLIKKADEVINCGDDRRLFHLKIFFLFVVYTYYSIYINFFYICNYHVHNYC